MPGLLPAQVHQVVADAIREVNTQFENYIRNGDAAGLAGLYTKYAELLPPNMDKVSGRTAIREFWAGAISAMSLKGARLVTEELFGTVSVQKNSQEFIEIGEYTLMGPTPRMVRDRGKYVVVWRYTAGEQEPSLEMHRDMWNSNMPPP